MKRRRPATSRLLIPPTSASSQPVEADRGQQGGVAGLNQPTEHLDHLYLLPGQYRRGIGSMLLDKAKSLSNGRMQLYAFQRNARARAFYEHHGFKAIESGDGSENEENEPDVLYEWVG